VYGRLRLDRWKENPVVHEIDLNPRLSRRDALKLAGGAAMASMLPVGASAQDATPAAVDGMYPSPIEGVPNAYYKYPAPFQTVTQTPGSGGTVKLAHLSDVRIKPRDDNQYWQQLEERLGVTLDVTLIPGAAYAERMATMIAGGDFPDLVFLLGLLYPQISEFQIQGAFTDVTAYLDGEARNAFPNLAAMPSYSFENSKLNGVLYGVPSPTSLQPNCLWYRADWLQTVGMAPPTNAAEFLQMIQAFAQNDPDGNGSNDTYGTSFERLDAVSQRFIHSMFRVGAEGDGWIVNPDGTFTHAIETPEFRAALEYAREVWASGACHPDSLTQTSNEIREQLMAGTTGSGPNAFILLHLIRTEAAKINANARIDGLVPPGHDGGQGVAYNIGGWFGQFAIPTPNGQDEARVQELLRICDYFGSPFGSEEYNFLVYGTEGVHHTVNDDGSRTLTQQGTEEVFNPSLGALNVLYSPVQEEIKYIQDLMAAQTRVGLFSPTVNLYSPAAAEKAGELGQMYTDRKIAISTGREGMESLDDWIADWKSRGGDEIRKEYEEAYAQAQAR
jgi:putative aldouronate transport system substrate-binding protein